MDRRGFITKTAAAAVSGAFSLTLLPTAFGAGNNNARKGRPNVIFLMDDQHRWDTFGFVNPAVQTPNLDAIAKEGVFFDQAVCQAPMCVPSRNSMM